MGSARPNQRPRKYFTDRFFIDAATALHLAVAHPAAADKTVSVALASPRLPLQAAQSMRYRVHQNSRPADGVRRMAIPPQEASPQSRQEWQAQSQPNESYPELK